MCVYVWAYMRVMGVNCVYVGVYVCEFEWCVNVSEHCEFVYVGVCV